MRTTRRVGLGPHEGRDLPPRIATVVALAAGLALAACDDGAASPASDPATADAVGADGDATPTPAPSERGERALTSGASDDLFPALDGDDLVWVRLTVDAAAAPAGGEPPDCMASPYLDACDWRLMTRKLPAGSERLLLVSSGVPYPPVVSGGHVVFTDSSNQQTWDITLAGGASQPLDAIPPGHRAVALRDGRVWSYGYDYVGGGMSTIAVELASGERVATVLMNASDYGWWAGALGALARPPSVDVGDDHLVWSTWSGSSVIMSAALDGSDPGPLGVDADLDLIRPRVVGDRAVVESYVRASGCGQFCALGLVVVGDDGGLTPIADAEPSAYVALASHGARVAWVDRRGGAYAIWGVALAADASRARPERLSSDAARIGTLGPPAVGASRVVWSDRRSGRWHLVERSWP